MYKLNGNSIKITKNCRPENFTVDEFSNFVKVKIAKYKVNIVNERDIYSSIFSSISRERERERERERSCNYPKFFHIVVILNKPTIYFFSEHVRSIHNLSPKDKVTMKLLSDLLTSHKILEYLF